MKVVMLGSGAADGWPTPFCPCASCATMRRRGELRGQTSALIDERILIDSGAEAPRSAVQAGLSLQAVSLLLFTHSHPDHCHPQVLLWRRWAELGEPLTVAGPADALEQCQHWVGPDDPVTFVELRAGDLHEHDGYRVRALAATHIDGALLYDIEDADGARILYATDTGPLPAESMECTSNVGYDALFLENTWGTRPDHGADDSSTKHHGLTEFGQTVAELRRRGALTAASEVVAIHLGHHNPPEPELSRRLAAFGATPAHDHEVFTVGVNDAEPVTVADRRPQRTLILGGARSGKSTEAERQVMADPVVRYIATSAMPSDDREWQERVEQHRARRPAHWTTVETIDLVAELEAAAPGTTVLIDCLTLWLTAMLDAHRAWDNSTGADTVLDHRLPALADALAATQARVVIVSNEVGSGIVPDTASGRLFRDALGIINARIAEACDEVLLVVAGRVTTL
jgi:adenosylcobinamide kinase/adenosylcobinamide-phosphate guanylyltransferase